MRVIALSGKIGSGKSWCADFLQNASKTGGHIYSIANALKADIILLGLDKRSVYKDKPLEIRALLQAYGAAWRAQDIHHWIGICCKNMDTLVWRSSSPLFEDRCISPPETNKKTRDDLLVIIDDLRFRNEVNYLREWAVKAGHTLETVRLSRSDVIYDTAADLDASECDLDNYCGFNHNVIAKSGDLDHLAAAMVRILGHHE